jgi:hypothetical protein
MLASLVAVSDLPRSAGRADLPEEDWTRWSAIQPVKPARHGTMFGCFIVISSQYGYFWRASGAPPGSAMTTSEPFRRLGRRGNKNATAERGDARGHLVRGIDQHIGQPIGLNAHDRCLESLRRHDVKVPVARLDPRVSAYFLQVFG